MMVEDYIPGRKGHELSHALERLAPADESRLEQTIGVRSVRPHTSSNTEVPSPPRKTARLVRASWIIVQNQRVSGSI